MYKVRLTPIFLRSGPLVIVSSVEVIDLHPVAVLSMSGSIDMYLYRKVSGGFVTGYGKPVNGTGTVQYGQTLH